MTHTEKDLKNKKQEDIINYILIGAFVITILFLLFFLLFIQPTKIGFSILLLLILSAVRLYLVDIKQVTEKSEKKALWKIVIKYMGIIIGIIALATIILVLEFILR